MKSAELFFDLRHDLVYRKLQGERLTLREEVTLSILNEAVRKFRPSPAPLPENVREAVREIHRLLLSKSRLDG